MEDLLPAVLHSTSAHLYSASCVHGLVKHRKMPNCVTSEGQVQAKRNKVSSVFTIDRMTRNLPCGKGSLDLMLEKFSSTRAVRL